MTESSGPLAPVVDRAEMRSPPRPLVTLTHVTYGLHAVGLAAGAFSAATIIGAFIFGWPSILAVIINYVKRDEARGTWLESHLSWQIRTFWFAVLWASLVVVVGFALTLVLIGFAILWIGLFALGIWATYRIVRGWMALNEGRALPAPR
jgi:uncharacterized membrane protein